MKINCRLQQAANEALIRLPLANVRRISNEANSAEIYGLEYEFDAGATHGIHKVGKGWIEAKRDSSFGGVSIVGFYYIQPRLLWRNWFAPTETQLIYTTFDTFKKDWTFDDITRASRK